VREVVKASLQALLTKDKHEKKFVLCILYDISMSPIFVKIMKEIPWTEGVGRLINYGYFEEPLCISLIMNNLYRDIVVRN